MYAEYRTVWENNNSHVISPVFRCTGGVPLSPTLSPPLLLNHLSPHVLLPMRVKEVCWATQRNLHHQTHATTSQFTWVYLVIHKYLSLKTCCCGYQTIFCIETDRQTPVGLEQMFISSLLPTWFHDFWQGYRVWLNCIHNQLGSTVATHCHTIQTPVPHLVLCHRKLKTVDLGDMST